MKEDRGSRRNAGRACAWALVAVAASTFCAAEPAAGTRDAARRDPCAAPEGATWRFEIDNDTFYDSDNQFTNGLSVQKHGPPSRDWSAARGTPAFGKRFAARFLPDHRSDLCFRESWSIGQSLQTPDDLGETDIIEDDVPYSAVLATQNTWTAYDDRRFYGFGWLLGVVGPAALGEPVQKGFHALINGTEPQGWNNQLDNEPVIGVSYDWKRKIARASWGDVAVGLGGNAGNLFTGLRSGIETRLGIRLPPGFVEVPDPVGVGLSPNASPAPRRPEDWSLYASFAVRSALVGYSVFYDGNLVADSPSVDHESLVHTVLVGLHFERPRWGVHLNVLRSTDMVDPDVYVAEPDTTLDYGSITVDIRF